MGEIKDLDLIISFGYRDIINNEIISHFKNPIINLHLSGFPFNKGAHPNFWSFIDNTPSGISIHEIDGGIDTGKIIYQKKIDFDLSNNKKKLNFYNTYSFLFKEIENLFMKNIDELINNKFNSYAQIGNGSCHRKKIFVKKQKGRSSYFKKRTKKDSEININKNIKSQFNLLRIVDNDNYPAFFKFKKNVYIIKIFKK